jgi:hypothetical protein
VAERIPFMGISPSLSPIRPIRQIATELILTLAPFRVLGKPGLIVSVSNTGMPRTQPVLIGCLGHKFAKWQRWGAGGDRLQATDLQSVWGAQARGWAVGRVLVQGRPVTALGTLRASDLLHFWAFASTK